MSEFGFKFGNKFSYQIWFGKLNTNIFLIITLLLLGNCWLNLVREIGFIGIILYFLRDWGGVCFFT